LSFAATSLRRPQIAAHGGTGDTMKRPNYVATFGNTLDFL
jgi:hypothetical protein